MRMLLAGGGTGGHLFPAVAIAEQLLRQDKSAQVCFVGTARGLEAKLLPQLGLPLELIDMTGVVGRGLRGLVQLVPKLLSSLKRSWQILQEFAPDIVVGVGGYASFPVLVAAKIKGIPFILHEQNAQPGLSNRILSRFARRVCLSIPGSGGRIAPDKQVVTGNPLRQGVTEVDPSLPFKGKLLVFGGSRGAHAINQLLIESLPLLRQRGVDAEVLHQTGESDFTQVSAAYEKLGEKKTRVVAFIDDMAAAYTEAQLVVCRAGATTIAELCACGRPAVMIPFPFAAADHQTANARSMEQAGAVKMLVQAELSAEKLAETIAELWQNRATLQAMAAAAARLGQKDAAERVIDVCQQVITGS